MLSLSTSTSALASNFLRMTCPLAVATSSVTLFLFPLRWMKSPPLSGCGSSPGKGSEASREVTLRRLDLDDVRAEVRQQPCAVGPRNSLGQVNDAYTLKREFGQGTTSLTWAGLCVGYYNGWEGWSKTGAGSGYCHEQRVESGRGAYDSAYAPLPLVAYPGVADARLLYAE